MATQADLQAIINAAPSGGTADLRNQGDVVVDTGLNVTKPLTVLGSGTRLIHNPPADGYAAMTISGGSVSANSHFSGTLTQGQVVIAVDHPELFTVGDTLLLNMGVDRTDPSFYFRRHRTTLLAKNGSVLTLADPLPEDVPVFSSSDLSWTSFPERTGAWGTPTPAGFAWGYGLDHRVCVLVPMEGVTLDGFRFALHPDLAAGVSVQAAIQGFGRCAPATVDGGPVAFNMVGGTLYDITLTGIVVESWRSQAFHFDCVTDITINDPRADGLQNDTPSNGGIVGTWFATNGYQSYNLTVNGGDFTGNALRWGNMELQCRNTVYNDCRLTLTGWDYGSNTEFFANFTGGDTYHNRCTVRGQIGTATTSFGVTSGEVTDTDGIFLDTIPGFVDLVVFDGSLSIGGKRYPTKHTLDQIYTIPARAPNALYDLSQNLLPAGAVYASFEIKWGDMSAFAFYGYSDGNTFAGPDADGWYSETPFGGFHIMAAGQLDQRTVRVFAGGAGTPDHDVEVRASYWLDSESTPLPVSITPSQVKRVYGSVRRAVAGEAIAAGQLAYIDTEDGCLVKLASTASAKKAVVSGVALNNASRGQPVALQMTGVCIVGGRLTPGAIYANSDFPGGIQAREGLSGRYVAVVGIALDAQQLELGICAAA